jgi:hypothetical protein
MASDVGLDISFHNMWDFKGTERKQSQLMRRNLYKMIRIPVEMATGATLLTNMK